MSEPDTPTTPSDAGRRLQRVHVTFTVDTPSPAHASNIVRGLVRAVADGRERHADLDEPRARLAGWGLTDTAPFHAFEPFEGTDIPDLVAEAFPHEPRREDFRTPAGSVDEDAFEGAHETWREECLTLAVTASRLPQLMERLERAERARDAILDVLDRYPVPAEPRREDYEASPAEIQDGYDTFKWATYSRDYSQWREAFAETVARREQVLRKAATEALPRTTFLPAQFHREWIPRDLMAVTALRALLDADPAVTGRLLDRNTRTHLAAMLQAEDPDVRIIDPDTDGADLYAGPASEAHRWIPPGVYEAATPDGEAGFRVVVGRAPMSSEGTASWAFPPAEHDSAILAQIARTLGSYAATEDGMSSEDLLDQLSDLVADSGRPSRDEGTRLENATAVRDLLQERGRQLADTDQHRPDRPGHGDHGITR